MAAVFFIAFVYLFAAFVKKAWFSSKGKSYTRTINKAPKTNREELDEYWIMKLSGVLNDDNKK